MENYGRKFLKYWRFTEEFSGKGSGIKNIMILLNMFGDFKKTGKIRIFP